jgi:hypothetical protein
MIMVALLARSSVWPSAVARATDIAPRVVAPPGWRTSATGCGVSARIACWTMRARMSVIAGGALGAINR